MNQELKYVYDIYIAAPASRVWKGIVDGDFTRQHVYGTRLETKLKKGGPYACVGEGNLKVVGGEILEVEAESRLAMSWNAHWDEASGKDKPSRVTYELSAPSAGTTKLRLVHDEFDGERATYHGWVEGSPLMLSSLKSILETGKPIPAK